MKPFILLLVLLFSIDNLFSQHEYIRIPTKKILTKDTLLSNKLIHSLTEFLALTQGPNTENHLVYENEKLETYILLDELKDISESIDYLQKKFYKPYLSELLQINDTTFSLKISYIGIKDSLAILRTIFTLDAHLQQNQFVFSSPLKKNTNDWKFMKVQNNIIYYKDYIDKEKLKIYEELLQQYDDKLGPTDISTSMYLFSSLSEMLQSLGVVFSTDYFEKKEGITSTKVEKKKIVLFGNNNAHFENYDPHDIWHDRLSLKIPRNNVYKPADEACAYLYGGSWGISWKEILQIFLQKVVIKDSIDWTEVKETILNFGETKEKHLIADYVVVALIIEKLEKENGFDAVWQLLTCGKWEKGNKGFYDTLEKLTGISKENYNDFVNSLIKKNRKH